MEVKNNTTYTLMGLWFFILMLIDGDGGRDLLDVVIQYIGKL